MSSSNAGQNTADICRMRNTIAQDLVPASLATRPPERRERERMPISMPVRVIYQDHGDEICQDGTCTDISEAGIAFETLADLYVGEIIDLEFRHSDASLFRFPMRLL